MPVKSMVVLANSIKKAPGRCIAGREVVISNGSLTTFGPWIRPVAPDSESKQGELYLGRHCSLQSGGTPQVLDVVGVPVTAKRQDPGQPENWQVASGAAWQFLGRFAARGLSSLCESPASLWVHTPGKTDRVSVSQQLAQPHSPSLVLIRPVGLRVMMYSVTDARGRFRYGQHEYSLKITDDVFNHKYAAHFLGGNGVPPFGDQCALCISLGTPFRGYSDQEDQHYKLIAAIIPT